MRYHTGFAVPRGAGVFIHQAFRCCPYAGMVTSRIHEYVERNGYSVVDDPLNADVFVVNTCGSDAEQSQLTYEAIRAARRVKPDVPVVATGCLNSIEPGPLRAALMDTPHHAMLDPRNLDGLDDLFEHDRIAFDSVHPSLQNRYAGTEFAERGWYHVGVSTGCLGTCTFCAIRRATGRPRSTPIPAVLADIDRGIAEGRRDILFVSTDVSAWGHDLGLTVVDLLRAAVDHPVEALYAGEAFEPTLFLEHFDALLPLLASGRFAWIGIPIQSGSQRILDQMQRPYAIDAVLEAVARLREAAPDLLLRTDILYGFGDETDADFQASLEACRHFDMPCFNNYQERPGTAKIELPHEVFVERRRLASEELRTRMATTPIRIRHMAGSTAPFFDEGRRGDGFESWRDEHAGRIEGLVGTEAMDVGAGWSVRSARVDHGDLRSILLELSDGERSFQVCLRHPEQQGSYVSVSEGYALWVRGRLEDPDAQQALGRLERALAGGVFARAVALP